MKYIETTININKDILENITKVSRIIGKSRTDTIVMLLKKVMKTDGGKACIHRRIKYQESRDRREWHTLHISFSGDEYEYFLDLRKLLKMSLSYIVAYAAKKYLNNLIKDKDTDNYYFENYILAKEEADGIIYWKFFWGAPGKIEKYIIFKEK